MCDSKHLPFAIVEFLNKKRGVLSEEASESLEVAVQCIQEAYDFSVEDDDLAKKYSTEPHGLEEIFNKAMAACPKASAAKANVKSVRDPVAADAKKAEGKLMLND